MRNFQKALTLSLVIALMSLVLVTARQSVTAQAAKGRSRIAFVSADYDTRTMTISLIDPATSAIIPIVKDGYFFFPVLSPDGKHLAFMGEHPKAGTRNLYIIETDGSNLRPLSGYRPQLKPDGRVAWSPDSTQLIYGANFRNGQPAGFFRVELDGDESEEIKFADIQVGDTWIVSSPDGSRLAIRVAQDSDPYYQLYITDIDGSNAQPVTVTSPNGQYFAELVWSPDNQQTLLSGSLISSSDPQPLVQGNADGADVKVLIKPPPNYINSPAWSPDGSQVAFLAPENAASKPDGGIWIVNANGSGKRTLNIPINVAYVGLSWGIIPDDVVLPSSPTSFTDALAK